MSHGHFCWTDLSTYNMAHARADYSELFGWTFHGEESYDFATLDGREVAAVFPMPPRLIDIQMPSFWMSYVQVDDLIDTVTRARSHQGVIVEVEPQSFGEDAQISLVRDPSGAGFTLYQGPDIFQPAAGSGLVSGRYHHVPELEMIESFYFDLFAWTFQKASDDPWPSFDVLHPDGSIVAQVEEVPEAIRGKFRYWMPSFRVTSTAKAIAQIEATGGGLASQLSRGRSLVSDRQGAHFIIAA